MELNQSLSWKSMLIGGLILSILGKILTSYEIMFSAVGVLGDMLFLFGIAGGIGSLFKKKK